MPSRSLSLLHARLHVCHMAFQKAYETLSCTNVTISVCRQWLANDVHKAVRQVSVW